MTSTATATARLIQNKENAHLCFIGAISLPLPTAYSLLRTHGFQRAAAEDVDSLRRVLTGQLHLSHHALIECAVFNLLGRHRHPNLSPVVAAPFHSHAAVSNLQRVDESLVVDHLTVLVIFLCTPGTLRP